VLAQTKQYQRSAGRAERLRAGFASEVSGRSEVTVPLGGRVKGAAAKRVLLAVLRSALESTLVLLVLSSLVFLALRLLPGDPALLILGEQASVGEAQKLRQALHLDRSLLTQYLLFLRDLVLFDHGDSLRRPGVSAMSRVYAALGPTAGLALLGSGLGAVFGIGMGVLSVGPWLGPLRHRVRGALDSVASLPLLAIAPVLTYLLAIKWHLLPLPGDPEARWVGLLFASGLLAIPLSAQVGRVTHASLEGVAKLAFVKVARAKGAGPARVWVLHALRVVSPTVLTVVAAQVGALFGGAVVLERLFERRGLGSLILESYASRDLPVLESAVFASGAIFVLTQSVAAALAAWLDPRSQGRT
jgi:peptide/nickel transport system permease protein